MYATLNFCTKSALRKAVEAGTPVALYSPATEFFAVNGVELVDGPWPGTRPPVEEIKPKRGKKRERKLLHSWHAKVLLRDGLIAQVLH